MVTKIDFCCGQNYKEISFVNCRYHPNVQIFNSRRARSKGLCDVNKLVDETKSHFTEVLRPKESCYFCSTYARISIKMPTLVELDQLLDIALTTPEIGTVNFNILRALLHEILRHLNIETKLIDIDNLRSDLKSAGDFIKDGYVEILNREIRSDGTPGTAESSLKATVDAEPEETIIGEKDNEGRSKSETQTIVVEESETQASERSPVPQDSPVAPLKPSSGLSVSPDSPTASLKPASGLSVKDHPPPASRSSVMLVRRSDSFRNLKKIISELQERVEVLESQPAPTADPVRSAASLVRKESKTPAHDFVELINIKRKLEASENSLEGLSDMVDALTADVNTLKDLLPSLSNQVPSKVTSEIEALKNSFKAFQDGEVSNMSAKNEKLESMLANLMDAMDEIKNKPSTKDEGPVSNEISEALQQKLETLEKQLEGVTAQIQVIEEKIEGTDERFCGAEQASNDTILQVKSLVVGVGDLNDKLAGLDDKLAGLDRGLKNHKTLIEDNEMQIHQLKNTITLLQRESLQRANEEVEKIKGRGHSLFIRYFDKYWEKPYISPCDLKPEVTRQGLTGTHEYTSVCLTYRRLGCICWNNYIIM